MFSMANISDWLIFELNKREWTQADLSRKAKISRAAVSNLMSGKRGIGRDLAVSIADALNVPLEEVFRATGDVPPAQSDQWVEKQSHRLSLITDPVVRKTVENIIDSIAQQEEASRKAKGVKLKRLLE